MNAPAEEWRVIADFPDYAVSDRGRVKRVRPKSDGTIRLNPMLKLVRTSRGYHQVTLWRDGRQYARAVHRLVCVAFHGNPPSARHVAAHGDGNGFNNHEANLRWATHLENEQDKRRHGTVACGERAGMAKLTTADVLAIRSDPRSARKIAADYGVSGANISIIVRGDSWKHVA